MQVRKRYAHLTEATYTFSPTEVVEALAAKFNIPLEYSQRTLEMDEMNVSYPLVLTVRYEIPAQQQSERHGG